MRQMLVIYNTCGLGHENTDYYMYALNNILAQEYGDGFEDYHVVLSACMNSQDCIEKIKGEFGNQISYNIVNEVLPLNVTFNHAILNCIREFGEFECYVYVDSGILFQRPDVLIDLWREFKSGNYGMVSTRVNNDSGYHLWFGVGSHHTDCSQDHLIFDPEWTRANGYKLDQNGNFLVPIGKCCNLHVQLFSNDFYRAYGKIMTDIFPSYCTESVFSFMVAALQKQWIITKDISVYHQPAMDGAALGYGKVHDLIFRVPKPVLEIIEPGIKYGMGYDESRGLVMHDPACYDENYLCLNNELKTYIRDNLFVPEEYLNYNEIQHEFIK